MNKDLKRLNVGTALLCIFSLYLPDGIEGLLINIVKGFEFREFVRFIVVFGLGSIGLVLFIQSKNRILKNFEVMLRRHE